VAFYRGLGSTPSAVTSTMQRRDLAIARQLVTVGATPAEAEAYAVETSGLEGRLAPVDLRSFERERAGWLVRHRRHERRHTDRTGLPPTWLEGAADRPPAPLLRQVGPRPGPPSPEACLAGTIGVTRRSDLAGSVLGRALRAALLPGSC
jgi:hypothetical protein